MLPDEDETTDTNDTDTNTPDLPDPTLPDERAPTTPSTDWRDALGIKDKKLKDSLGKFTSGDAFVQSYNHVAGKLKSAIFVPGEGAADEDVAKFRKSLGVPEAPEGYLEAIQASEGKEYDEGDMAIIEEFAEVAYENNIPAPAFNAFMAKLSERASGLRQSVADQIEDAREAAEEELAKKWGNDFDKNVQLSTRAAKAHGGDPFIKFLNSTKVEGAGLLGDHPAMVEFLASIGAKSDEHDMVLQSSAQERQSAQAELDKIYEEHPVGSDSYKSKAVQRRIQELTTKIHGDRPIQGAAA